MRAPRNGAVSSSLVSLRRQGLFFLSSLTGGSILALMKQPEEFILAGVGPRAGPPRNWHGFTSPSNRVAVSAAQFNCSVSAAPPTSAIGKINHFSRRHDGYTARS